MSNHLAPQEDRIGTSLLMASDQRTLYQVGLDGNTWKADGLVHGVDPRSVSLPVPADGSVKVSAICGQFVHVWPIAFTPLQVDTNYWYTKLATGDRVVHLDCVSKIQ